MAHLDDIRAALRRLKVRLAEGEIDRAEYDGLREAVLADLSPAERDAVTGASTPPPTPKLGPAGATETRRERTAAPKVAPGTVLHGQWRVVRELGRGGFGAVYEAEDLHLRTARAVKLLDPEMVGRSDLLERFHREVRLMQELVHPRVVRVYDYREDLGRGLALFAMERVVGCSVRELLALAREAGETVPVALATRILEQTLEALAAAHDRGVIHRDVTPGNILLAGGTASELLSEPGRDPEVKLVDFGIAGLAERTELSSRSRVLGTAAYVAPEIHDETAPVTAAADVYGAAAVAYELLTGRRAVVTGGTPVDELRDGVPPPVAAGVTAALAADPAMRPTAAELLALVRGAGGSGRAGEGSRGSQSPGGGRRGLWVVAAVVTAFLAAAGIWLGSGWWGTRDTGGRDDAAQTAPVVPSPSPSPTHEPTGRARTETPTPTSVPASPTPTRPAPTATPPPRTPTPAVAALDDEELLERIGLAAAARGIEFMPSPLERALEADVVSVLLGETPDFYGTLPVDGSLWVPVGQPMQQLEGAFYDRELARSVVANAVGEAPAGGMAGGRGRAAGEELLGRLERRVAAREDEIRQWLRTRPDLGGQRPLLGATAAWAAASGGRGSTAAVLGRAEAAVTRMQRGDGYSGHWYGVVSQRVEWGGGVTIGLNLLAQVLVEHDGSTVRGGGRLGNGHEITFSGTVDGVAFTGTLTNLTAGLESTLSGQLFERRFLVDYVSEPSGVRGRAVLVR